jgi:DNA ligase (NAD+)
MKISPPSHCPSCGEDLSWENDILYCHNSLCSAKNQKRIEHFTKTLKIKGFGPATIQKLNISSILDIYDLTFDVVSEALNSEIMATKLLEEIEKSKSAPLEEVLPALSIPLIGKTATAKLCGVIESIFDINEPVCLHAGLGPKATESLMDWYNFSFTDFEHLLPFDFNVSEDFMPNTSEKVVCISGRLKSFKTKGEAERVLVKSGYRVVSNLTKEVTILINESGTESSKTRKARDRGVSIVTNINQLL